MVFASTRNASKEPSHLFLSAACGPKKHPLGRGVCLSAVSTVQLLLLQSCLCSHLRSLRSRTGLVGCTDLFSLRWQLPSSPKRYHYLISVLFTYVILESLRPKEEKNMFLIPFRCRSLCKPPHPNKVTSGRKTALTDLQICPA